MAVKSTRFTVVELLMRVEKGAYSNLVLDGALEKSGYSDRDKAFVSRLFYGVLERKLTLRYIAGLYSKKPLQRLDSAVLTILETGLYQLLYMESVTDSATVNESVKLAKQFGKASASGFVNGVLRNFIRDGKSFPLPEDRLERLSVEYSCSRALVEKLCDDYSYERTEKLLRASVEPHRTFLRVNNLKTTAEELAKAFGDGVKACDFTDNCLEAERLSGVERSEHFRAGLFHVQDLSSQLCCKALGPKPGETVIDLCAAPGGKAFTFTEMMEDKGRVIACDIHENRVQLIKSGAERLGLTAIEAVQNDAAVFNPALPAADKVLCDVPCSGFGVIRTKPELKYTDMASIKELPELQYRIICTGAKYLKPGGELVYSTCTLNRDENDRILERFLEEHRDFRPIPIMEEFGNDDYKMTIFPGDFGCEGFFMGKVRKAQ